MRQLVLDKGLAPEDRDAEQQKFFLRHLQPWYGRFCDAIEAAPGTEFYQNVAGFARAFLELEQEFFRIE